MAMAMIQSAVAAALAKAMAAVAAVAAVAMAALGRDFLTSPKIS